MALVLFGLVCVVHPPSVQSELEVCFYPMALQSRGATFVLTQTSASFQLTPTTHPSTKFRITTALIHPLLRGSRRIYLSELNTNPTQVRVINSEHPPANSFN